MIRLGKTFILIGLLMAIVLGAGPAFANLVTNGDFEAGNSGFTSEYDWFAQPVVPASGYANPKASLYDEGTYGVGTSPSAYHVSWATFGDHTTGQGNMMIVNGDTTADVEVWNTLTSAPVTAGTKYYFSAWLTSVYPAAGTDPIAPASLAFSIGDIQQGADFTLLQKVGVWSLFYTEWEAPINGLAEISVINKNTTAGGNDFAMDDIVFDTRNPDNPVPIPAAVWLFGTGLLGLFGVRRKIVK